MKGVINVFNLCGTKCITDGWLIRTMLMKGLKPGQVKITL